MLKTHVENEVWLVQQHHHAQTSGYLAAHWGGVRGFAKPGQSLSTAPDPALWRNETVLGIAEHDNGWWEWEAMPRINGSDGLPVGLGESPKPCAANEFDEWRAGGFDRWLHGVHRVAAGHPYSALLINLHAYWLYAPAFPDLMNEESEAFRHFIFGDPETAARLVSDEKKTRAFLLDLTRIQTELKQHITEDARMAGVLTPDNLSHDLRLLQLLDTLSLFMSMNSPDDHVLPDVPRANWSDRTTLNWKRIGARDFTLDPYPFDLDPLRVQILARVVPAGEIENPAELTDPIAHMHSAPMQTLDFTISSGR